MKTAISLYQSGKLFDADDASITNTALLRLVCPECLESVILVQREYSHHFAHHQKEPDSPPCSLRTQVGDGMDRIRYKHYSAKMNKLLDEQVFQEAILKRLGLASLPDFSSDKTIIEGLKQKMQRVWINEGRCIGLSGLCLGKDEYKEIQKTTDEVVQFFISIHAPRNYQSLGTVEHDLCVLLLWKHLHLEQSGKDLSFLLCIASYLLLIANILIGFVKPRTASPISAEVYLAIQARSILMQVPWLEIETLLKGGVSLVCDVCGQVFSQLQNAATMKCDTCSQVLCPLCYDECASCKIDLCKEHAEEHRNYTCPDCGQTICETIYAGYPNECIVCGELVCAECYHNCECCSEAVCDDCFHDEYMCESCGENFCEYHPDNIQKAECSSCNAEYCEECASESVFKCPLCGDEICDKCCNTCDDCGLKYCDTCIDSHACITQTELIHPSTK